MASERNKEEGGRRKVDSREGGYKDFSLDPY